MCELAERGIILFLYFQGKGTAQMSIGMTGIWV